MARSILDETRIHPAIRDGIAAQNADIVMWSGWPTFPMVFVKGVLVGGAEDLARLHASSELAKLLA